MKQVTLSEVCDLKNGFAFKSKDYVEHSNTLSCRMSSIRPGGNFDLHHNQRFLPDEYVSKYSEYLLFDGDIVIAMTDLAGDPKILGVPTIVKTEGKNLLQNQRVGKLIVLNEDEVFIPFLQYALNRPENKSYYKKFAGGGLQINVGKKEILNNKIPLPPLATQKKIAAILDEADTLRQLNKQLITKYDALTQSLFLEMFGDPVTNPMGWEIEKLSDVCVKITDGTHHSPESQSSGFPYVTAKHVKPFQLNFEAKPTFVNEKAHNEIYKRCNPEYGDVFYIKDGATTGIACINTFKEPVSMLSSLALLKLSNKLNNQYLCHWLNHKGVKKRLINEFMSGAAIKRYTLRKIQSFKIVLPSLNLQNQFAERVALIEQQKAQAQQSLQKSEDLFNSLLQKAFKGELVK